MKRFVTRALIVVAATLGIVFAQVAPASATVHEIVAQWCSGHEPLGPPGISGGSKANNFAKPLNASGFIIGTEPFVGPDGPGIRVLFNYGNPNVKVVPTGAVVNISEPGEPPVYIDVIQPDPAFPAFQKCPALAG